MPVRTSVFVIVIITGFYLMCVLSPAHCQTQDGSPSASPEQMSEDLLDAPSFFMEAHKHYSEGMYSQAAHRYEKLIHAGIRTGEMYYNLGNSYFKMGMLGKAIVSYRLAEIYLPRDEDLKANLSYARQLTKDQIESKQFFPFIKQFCFWYSSLNLRELLLVFLTVHFLLWLLALLKIFWKNEYWNFIFLINLAVTIVLGFSLIIKLYALSYNNEGVVVAKEITVRSGNATANTALFQLHDGAEFKITKQESEWLQIELADGKRGWVEERWTGICRIDRWPPLITG